MVHIFKPPKKILKCFTFKARRPIDLPLLCHDSLAQFEEKKRQFYGWAGDQNV